MYVLQLLVVQHETVLPAETGLLVKTVAHGFDEHVYPTPELPLVDDMAHEPLAVHVRPDPKLHVIASELLMNAI